MIHVDWGAVTFLAVSALVVASAALLRPMIVGVPGPSIVFWLLYFMVGGLAWLMLMAGYWAGAGGARGFLRAATAAVTDTEDAQPASAASRPGSPAGATSHRRT